MKRTTAFLLAVGASATLLAQSAPTTSESYGRARRLVDQAVAAHGGIDALRAARQMRVRREGVDVWRNQSRGAAPPYDRERFASDMHIDLANGRLVAEEARTYPGGTHRHFSFVTSRDGAYYLNHRRRTFYVDDFPPAETQTGNLWGLPQLLLLAAHESDSRLRALGRITLSSGAIVEAVATTADGNSLTLGFEPETHLVRAQIGMRADAVEGLSANEVEFLSYRLLDGVLMPERRVNWTAGEITQETTFTSVMQNYTAPDTVVRPPASYQKSVPPESQPVRELAPRVWLIGGSAASLVVSMDDHLIVIDASPGSAATVAKLSASLAPGAPIRYVAPTHHHDDHAPGLRTFAQAGATVVTTPGNQALFERLSGARAEIVTGARTFTAGGRRLELHDLGDGPHAREMLVAWLPMEGILFSADLIDIGGDGEVHAGMNNDTTMHFARSIAAKGWTVRTHAGAHGGVIDDATFKRIVAQPIVPQAQLPASQDR